MVQIITGLLSAGAIVIVAVSSLVIGPSKIESLQAEIKQLKSELINAEQRVQDNLDNLKDAQQKFGTALTDIPQVRAFFETSLQDSITSSQTTMTLVSATDKDGNTLASSTYGFVIDEGTALEELVMGSCTSTSCSGLIRGLSVSTGTSSVSALQKAHRRGASVKITDAPSLLKLNRLASGIDSFPAPISYTSGVTNAQISADGGNLVNYTLLAATAIAGAVDASPTVKGIVELATGNEAASSTAIGAGDTSAGLVLYTALSSQQPTTSGYTIVVTRNNGAIDENFIATNSPYNWAGQHTFGADESFEFQGFGIGTSSPGTFNLLSVEGNALLSGTTSVGAIKFATTSPIIAYPTGSIVLPSLSGATAGQQLQLVDASTGETAWQPPAGSFKLETFNSFDGLGAYATRTNEIPMNSNTTPLFQLFHLPAPMDVTKITLMVKQVNVSGSVNVGIYTLISGAVTKVMDVNSGAISANGFLTISTTTTSLNAGSYYFGVIPVGTADVSFEGIIHTDNYWLGGTPSFSEGVSGEPLRTSQPTIAEAGVLPDTFDETANSFPSTIDFRLDN